MFFSYFHGLFLVLVLGFCFVLFLSLWGSYFQVLSKVLRLCDLMKDKIVT